jgi:bifunctional non-homologous end joining protein LigD
MALTNYRRKRRFAGTPEPAGSTSDSAGSTSDSAGSTPGPAAGRRGPDQGRFVVQRHRARRLHFDFRLEIAGVLASWAVPRGPSLDPSARRLAVHVEDHPVEYFDFEGVIPRGQYGGGDVIVWDWGRWTADPSTPDGAAAIAAGELKFRLDGERLHGAFVLLRTILGRDPRHAAKDKWLLIHRRDGEAVAGWDANEFLTSVKSARTNDDVALRRDAASAGAR